MALAFSTTRVPIKPYASGGYRIHLVSITLDTDYPTNGWPITAANVGLARNIAHLLPGSAAGWVLHWDAANSKLMAYGTGAGSGQILVEASSGENGLASLVVQVLVIGD